MENRIKQILEVQLARVDDIARLLNVTPKEAETVLLSMTKTGSIRDFTPQGGDGRAIYGLPNHSLPTRMN